MDIKENIVKGKVRFTRGQFWMYFLKDILMFGVGMFAFLEMIKETWLYPILFSHKWQIYCIGPIVYIFGGYFAGYIDERFGIWIDETEYYTKITNIKANLHLAEVIKTVFKEK